MDGQSYSRRHHEAVERDRLRERERQARAQMSSQAAEREQEAVGGPLFGAPVRVTPSAADPMTQEIQTKLGDYDSVKSYMVDHIRLIGITGLHPPASPAPSSAPSPGPPPVSRVQERLQPPAEFKKPTSHHSSGANGRPPHHYHHSQSAPRGGFVKPAEGKPPYGGRGGYPGQPVKHGGNGSNDHRSNGFVPPKGPPLGSNRIHQASRTLAPISVPRIQGLNQQELSTQGPIDNVENILKEMRKVHTPLSGIATPIKEPENKFTFNPITAKVEGPARPTVYVPRIRPSNSQSQQLPTTNLAQDLSLSEDSDDEKDEPKRDASPRSPATMEPPQVNASPATTPVLAPPEPVAAMSPVASSSSDSGSGSDTDTESSSEDTDNEEPPTLTPADPPDEQEVVVRPLSPPPEVEEETKPRWNLGSFLKKDQPADDSKLSQTTPTPHLESSPPDSTKAREDDSDASDSNKELDIVVKEALQKPQPLLSSFSDSDDGLKKAPVKEKEGKKRRRPTLNPPVLSDSDSDVEAVKKEKPRFPKRPSVRRSRQSVSSSDEGKRSRETSVDVKRGRGRPPTSQTIEKHTELRRSCPSPSSSEDEKRSRENSADVKRSRGNNSLLETNEQPCPVLRSNQSASSSEDEKMSSSNSVEVKRNKEKVEPPAVVDKRRNFKRPVGTPSGSEDEEARPMPKRRPTVVPANGKEKRKRGRGRPPKEPKRQDTSDDEWKDKPRKGRPPGPKREAVAKEVKHEDSSDDEWKDKIPRVHHGKGRPSRDSSSSQKEEKKKEKARKKAIQRRTSAKEAKEKEEAARKLTARNSAMRFKSEEQCPTPTESSDSEVDVVNSPKKGLRIPAKARHSTSVGSETRTVKSRHSSPESRWDSDRRRRSLDSDSDPPPSKLEESPPKLDTDGKAIQDKKKSDTLRKLFSTSLKREQEGAKGGAKGGYGAKGGKGKGKGGSKTPGIVVECESDRTLSENHIVPSIISPRLLSPLHSIEIKVEEVPVKVTKSTDTIVVEHEKLYKKTVKEPDKSNKKVLDDFEIPVRKEKEVDLPPLTFKDGVPSLMCRVELNRLPVNCIPNKRRSEEVRTRTELSDTRQKRECDSVSRLSVSEGERVSKRPHSPYDSPEEGEIVIPKCDTNSDRIELTVLNGCDNELMSKSSKKQKRKNSWNNGDRREQKEASSSNKPTDNESKSKHHRRKRDRRPSGSSLSSMSTVASQGRSGRHRHSDGSGHKKRREDDTPKSQPSHVTPSYAVGLTDAPATNHERDSPGSTNSFPHLMDWQPRVYYSYFDVISEDDVGDQHEYLSSAKRLKHLADAETDPTAQAMLYLEAVMYFLLTGNAIEHESSVEKTPFTMYKDTLRLIKFIPSKFQTQHSNPLHASINSKLTVLSLRCQSLLHLKLYKMKKHEAKETQKIMVDYTTKVGQPTPVQHGEGCVSQVVGGQGTPSPLSPTPSPAGSVGSVGSQSSGYSSGELRGGITGPQNPPAAPMGPFIAVPLPVHSSLAKHTQYCGYLMSSYELWEQADALVFKEQHRDFFIILDRFCGPLTLHSSLSDLVRYMKTGIQKLKEMRSSQGPLHQ